MQSQHSRTTVLGPITNPTYYPACLMETIGYSWPQAVRVSIAHWSGHSAWTNQHTFSLPLRPWHTCSSIPAAWFLHRAVLTKKRFVIMSEAFLNTLAACLRYSYLRRHFLTLIATADIFSKIPQWGGWLTRRADRQQTHWDSFEADVKRRSSSNPSRRIEHPRLSVIRQLQFHHRIFLHVVYH